MALSIYKEKRDFKTTTEPKKINVKNQKGLPIFVIQRHDARALHFDLRLEFEGELLSWAVTKKPVRNKNVKRLAVQVENHPLEYAKFKGFIPKGNYGAGVVQIWDQGTFLLEGANSKKENEKILKKKMEKGHFVFQLFGEKFKGKFVLVKLNRQENNWLLYYDEEDIAEPDEKDDLNFYGMLQPMIPTLVSQPFNKKDWIFEPKLDGYRAISVIDKKTANIFSRNGMSLNDRFSSIRDNLFGYSEKIILDGEIVAFNEHGRPDFGLLRDGGHSNLYYYVFDILYYKRTSLLNLPLRERRQILEDCIIENDQVKELFYVENDGVNFFSKVTALGFEGMVGKDLNSLYTPGTRTLDWLKVKNTNTKDLYVVGYIPDAHGQFKSLMVAEKKGSTFDYLGNVGTGYNQNDKELLMNLLRVSSIPDNLINYFDQPTATFVKPKVMIEVGYLEVTKDGRLRHPVFRRIRDDK